MSSLREQEWELEHDQAFKQATNASFWLWVGCGGPAVVSGFPLPLVCTPFYYACHKPALRENIYSRKLVTTENDIIYSFGPSYGGANSPFACKLSCCLQGKSTKTIPFNRVQDVSLREPGSVYCCCYNDELHTVSIQTASGNMGLPELMVAGVKDAEGFRKLCMDRRGGGQGLGGGSAVSTQPGGGKSVADRLKELETLKDQGILSSSEYEAKRGEILKSL